MDRHKNVLQNEKYSNDVYEAVMDNIKKKFLLKQQTYFWGPTSTFFSCENILNSFQTEKEEVHEKEFKNESASSSTQATWDKKELRRETGIPLHREDDRIPPKSFSVKEDMNLKNGDTGNDCGMGILLHREDDRRPPKMNLKNSDTVNDYVKMPQKTIMNGTHSSELVDRDRRVSRTENAADKFSGWCKKRQEKFLYESNLKLTSESTSNKRPPGKRIRPKSKSPVLETRKTPSCVNARHSQKFSKSMTQLDTHMNKIKPQVCIKITDERKEKNQEFTVDISDLSRIKRSFPKLKEVLPEVDAGIKTAQFSMEAIIFVLRFALFRRYIKDVMPSATVGVEILSAVKTWEVNELQHLFLKDFLQKILPSSL